MRTLLCTKCKTKKPEDDFRWRSKEKGQRNSWCRLCMSEHEKQYWKKTPGRRTRQRKHGENRRTRNAVFLWNYLAEHPCVLCGEKDPIVLDFDHRDRDTKRGAVSDMSRGSLSLETIVAEIEKCDVLCANCHRRRTAKQCGWYKSLTGCGLIGKPPHSD